MENQQFHVLLVTYPAQGHINPTLQFAKRLIRLGIEVTFAISLFAHRRMTKNSAAPKGMNFAVFSDGYDDGLNPKNFDGQHYVSELKRRGSDTLRDVIRSSSVHGRPVTCLVYTVLLPWVAEVAREVHIPSALLWIQPATVLDIYYYYFFSGCGDEVNNNGTDPHWKIQFPGLPLLEIRDLPSLIIPDNDSSSGTYSFALPIFKIHLDVLNQEEERPTVLVNTFDALEPEALRAIDKYNMIGIGPLVPSGKDSSSHTSDASFGNLFEETKDYKEWLNSKPASSVIYVSFGSLLKLERQQMVEIARALLDSGRPFLWVIRAEENGQEELDDELLSLLTNDDQLQEKGMIVPWCSQVAVLSHPSLGCFLTHCGWNSTLESIVYGVPVIAFPQWSDQGTNAKLLESVSETGVRVGRAKEDGGGGIVERDEIKRCIELVMEDGGRKAMELRKNAQKWKDLAREAMREGGSSDKNLKSFLEDIGERYSREKICGNNLT